jgi:hypothetical protein
MELGAEHGAARGILEASVAALDDAQSSALPPSTASNPHTARPPNSVWPNRIPVS